jgi:Tol biopolymer transport system component
MTLLSPTDAKIIKQFDKFPVNTAYSWTPDSQSISFADNSSGIANLWLQPIETGEPQKLTDSQVEEIIQHSWTKDNKNLVFVKETTNNDIVLINNAAP